MARKLGQTELLPLTAGRYGVAISWDHTGQAVDVDLQAVVVDNRGVIIDAVYYNNLKALKCLTHSGDEQTGEKAGYDEIVWAGLAKLPETVKMIIFIVATHTGHLRDVQNGMIHVLEERKDNEVAKFAMEKSVEEVDLVAAMIRSDSNAWTLQVVDEPAQDGRHFIDILEPTIGNFIRKNVAGAPKRQKVAFAMEKGAVFDLPQSNAMQCIIAGLGWDVRGDGVDLDVSAVLFDGNGKEKDAVFFGNLVGSGLSHSGDNLTGEGSGDDERIKCELEKIPGWAQQIIFVVNIYTKGMTFELVSNAYCRIVDDSENELARYSLSEGQRQNGLIIARLFREVDGRWGFQAVGAFARGQTWKDSIPDMKALFKKTPQDLQMRGSTRTSLTNSQVPTVSVVSVAPPGAPVDTRFSPPPSARTEATAASHVPLAQPPVVGKEQKACCNLQ